ncbi:MAG TPA: RidA family protein [Candidatus Binataceae bacterium]|nr:RidA family protein [Candidatus Binataceae bacterium]
MEKKPINPWKWQDQFGFSHAIEVKGGERVLYCAGQTSSNADGQTMHAGDMKGQINLALDNLEAVLKQAGMSLSNVVRLNYYTPDVDLLLENYGVLVGRLAKAGCQPASTLLGVARLAFKELLIEIEATAVA